MTQRDGQIRVEYEGVLPEALREHLRTERGTRVAGLRPLTLVAGEPEAVLNRIMRYLGDGAMEVRRVELRKARAS